MRWFQRKMRLCDWEITATADDVYPEWSRREIDGTETLGDWRMRQDKKQADVWTRSPVAGGEDSPLHTLFHELVEFAIEETGVVHTDRLDCVIDRLADLVTMAYWADLAA